MSNTKGELSYFFYAFHFKCNGASLSLLFLYYFHGFQDMPKNFILPFQ